MSMRCKCGARAMCIDSRATTDRETRRRYKCSKKKCGDRWSTVEMVAPNSRQGYQSAHALKDAVAGRLGKRVVDEIERKIAEVLEPFRGMGRRVSVKQRRSA